MTRILRDQIDRLLSTVAEALKDVKKMNADDAFVVLNDCFGAADSVKSTLERELSAERSSFYAEKLGEAQGLLQEINDLREQDAPAAGQVKDARKLLNLVRRELEEETEVKTTVVFLPYKASMWDCMESIWQAAVADRRCEVHVVPIPYYDKRGDGSLGQRHLEADQFPDYVPVESYQEYAPAQRQPDIAYIHNPYDGNNYVTTVDPAFYSAALKQHVRTLVYVPYFVSDNSSEGGPGEAAVLLHADILVTQNEADRQLFKRLGSRGEPAALGSPKIDRVLALDKNKPPMPPEWEAALAGKTVFLLITSVADFLTHSGTMIAKLQNLFAFFEANPGAGLLWRPHPLTKATLASMRPGLLKEYEELEAWFRQQQFCAFDASTDVDRAIALSDAYVGARGSSVAYMYGITGKPVYQLDGEISRAAASPQELEEELRGPMIVYAAIHKDSLWFSAIGFNALCRAPLAGGKAEMIAEFPGEPPFADQLFLGASAVGDTICFAPGMAAAFTSYDIAGGTFFATRVPGRYYEPTLYSLAFNNAFAHGGRVAFAPFYSHAAATWAPATGKVAYYEECRRLVEPYIQSHRDMLFRGTGCVQGNRLFLPFAQGDAVLELDLDSGHATLHPVPSSGTGYAGIAYDGAAFWLTQNNQWYAQKKKPEAIVRWVPQTGEVTEFAAFPEGFTGGDRLGPSYDKTSFWQMVYSGGKLLAFPHFANMIVQIDPKTGKMTEFSTGLGNKLYSYKSPGYHFGGFTRLLGQDETGRCVVSLAHDNSLLLIDAAGQTCLRVEIPFRMEGLLQERLQATARFRTGYYYFEQGVFPVGSFVEKMLSGEIAWDDAQAKALCARVANGDGTSGQKIHEYACRHAQRATHPAQAEN